MFSFNNPFGACPVCTGLGSQLKADPALVIPKRRSPSWTGLSARQRLEQHPRDGISRMYFDALAKKYHFSLREPVGNSRRRSWT